MLLDETSAFVQVVRAGSFTAAGKHLGVPKSTLSRQVARLEAQLDSRLLQRTTRRLSLTETGRAYYERCQQALASLEEAERVVRNESGKPRGNLRVSLPFDFARAWVAPLLKEFRADYPEIELALIATQRPVDLVAEGIDVALRGGILDDTEFVSKKIATSNVVLCAAPSYLNKNGRPQSFRELETHDLVGMGQRGRPAPLQFEGPEGVLTLPGKPWLVANEWGILLRALRDGLGIGPMIDITLGEFVAKRELERVLADYSVTAGGLYAVYPSRHHLSPKVRVFVDFISGHVQTALEEARRAARG